MIILTQLDPPIFVDDSRNRLQFNVREVHKSMQNFWLCTLTDCSSTAPTEFRPCTNFEILITSRSCPLVYTRYTSVNQDLHPELWSFYAVI